MEQPKAIGVVGGVGPYAGLDLVKKIFDQTIAQSDQEHLPVILISLPAEIEDRTEFLLRNSGNNPARSISAILQQLEDAGATVAGIPCNTAHAPQIFQEVSHHLSDRQSRLRLLSLVEETLRSIASIQPRPRRIGLLATTGTRSTGIYRDPLHHNGFVVVELDDAKQAELVQDSIYDTDYGIKAKSNPVSERARRQLVNAMDDLVRQGVDAIILGCTELPLAIPEIKYHDVVLIDPATLLARALIRAFNPSKLRPSTPRQ